MTKLNGKTGRVLKAVACRVADKEDKGHLPSAFELALKKAVEKAIEHDSRIQFREAA